MSDWNLRLENTQVVTDTVMVTAVNREAVPRFYLVNRFVHQVYGALQRGS